MGFLEEAKEKAEQLLKAGQEKFCEAYEATEEFADEKTGGKFSEVTDKVGDFVDDAKDKIGELVAEGKEKLGDATDKVGDIVDDKTGDSLADKVDDAQGAAQDKLSD